MNQTKKILLKLAIIGMTCGLNFQGYAQDSITVDDLRQFSYPFDIQDGVLSGPGAEIMTKAISNAHVVMLGNNSRNKLEADLDLALAEELDKSNYNTLIMEIGPNSADIVNRLSGHSSGILDAFKKMNQEYFFEAGGLQFMAIPDFKYVGASQLLDYIKERDWSFDAIGVDSWTGYKLVTDELYNNLSKSNQQFHTQLYQSSIDLLDSLYANMEGQSYDDVLGLTSGLKASASYNLFLEEMSAFDINTELLKQLRFSIDYWWMYGSKQGYKKNKLSSQRNKVLIKEILDGLDYNFEKDKLFLKMWRGHLTNGVTRNGFYGVGNMLMELANYHGHSSLNIGVLSRFTIEDGVIEDRLDNPEQVPMIQRPFVSLGEADQWVLVDMRHFNETFYWGNYILTIDMLKMMRRFDMIIIPKADSKAKVNN